MPIKGLTDRGLAFPEIGKIRKGAPKAQNAPGADLKYFRVEFDEKETDAAATFRAVYGQRPDEIYIVLPFNEIERQFEAWLEGYSAGRMVARSDGEIYTYLVDSETGEILVKNGLDVKTGKPRPYIDGVPVGFYTNRKTNKREPIFCKPTGRLKVVIPELGRAAYLVVLTTSRYDIMHLSEQLAAFQTVNNGRIAGIPLVLRRRPKMISTPSPDGKRVRREKWLLSIEASPDWVRQMLGEVQRLAAPGGGLSLLPAPHAPAEIPEPPEPEIEDGDYQDADEDEDFDGEYQDDDESESQAEPMTKEDLDLNDAMEMLTPKGARMGGLTDEQLTAIANGPQDTDARREYATVARMILRARERIA